MNKKGSDWEKLNLIFATAVELSATQRTAYLADVCDGDEDLLSEAEAILTASNRAASQDFLEDDAFGDGAKIILSSDKAITVGGAIGKYKIIREIGRGGMGAIYLGEHEDFQHRVALKVIKRGMDTDEIIRRFQQERDVLAALNHPNIARLLDGGTTANGLPFLVMEYVEGSPLNDFCEQNSLNIDERLGLFRKICSAVAYAHQHLIVHRDLKPSNIIVDSDGEPKLLDFGIAKLLTPDASGQTTENGFRMLTPEYASPEQIRGERVTTTSDVYSLGVLLYELLTGTKPYQITSRNAVEIMRVVCETAPERPSSVVPVSRLWPVVDGTQREKNLTRSSTRMTRSLKGDLDNIILKALQKNAELRYFSVEQFAEDIERYLTGLPVIARRATLGYQLAKFVERNRTTVALASVALIAVLAGSSIAVWQAVVAGRERASAESRLTEIRKLTGNLVAGWDKDIPETQITSLVRGRIADISAEYLENLANETNNPVILKELAEAYLKLGHEYSWGNVNEQKAKASFQKAESIARKLIALDANDLDAKDLLVRSLWKYDEYFGKNDRQRSLGNHFERLSLREAIYAARPSDEKTIEDLANAVHNCGWSLKLIGQNQAAVPYYERAAALTKQQIDILEPVAKTETELGKLSELYSTMAMNQTDIGLLKPSIENYRHAAQLADQIYLTHPDDRTRAGQKATTQFDLGLILKKTGDMHASSDAFRAGLDAAHRQNLASQDGYLVVQETNILFDMAENFNVLGDDAAAMRSLKEAFEVWERFASLEINKGNSRNIVRTAALNFAAGKLLLRMGKQAEARTSFDRTEKLYIGLFDTQPDVRDDRLLARLYLTIGDMHSGSGICRSEDAPFAGFVNQLQYCPARETVPSPKTKARSVLALNYYRKAVTILSGMETDGQIVAEDINDLRIAREKLSLFTGDMRG